VTGIIWSVDHFVLSRKRRTSANLALANFDANIEKSHSAQSAEVSLARSRLESDIMRQPAWIEYSGSFFPVIALVFVLRSFLFEPFKIPSGSMLPTLFVGDLILVNKFTYGIRLPILGTKVVSINDPQRGDVMVFKYPKDPSKDYIKRVVGVPGDKIIYRNKQLNVNGADVSYGKLNDFLHEGADLNYASQFDEDLLGVKHKILNDADRPASVQIYGGPQFPNSELCSYNEEGFICSVPQGHYFMMGDNRDNSEDSRYWGFVPDQNIVGKAFFIWMNFGAPKRIGSFN
jgi:signal peptidase I